MTASSTLGVWVRTSDALPPDGEKVLASSSPGEVTFVSRCEDVHNGDRWLWHEHSCESRRAPTFWCSIPPLPEE